MLIIPDKSNIHKDLKAGGYGIALNYHQSQKLPVLPKKRTLFFTLNPLFVQN